MKIALTGGGTGGHFYPLIAVAYEINAIVKERKLVTAQLFYLSDSPFDRRALFENNIEFYKVRAGKMRRYHSWLNWLDSFKTAIGILSALWKLFWLYPQVIFSKGGYASFPVLFAARILRIPVLIHESDSHPGRVNLWSAKFARRVAIAFPEVIKYFPKEKTALIGVPVRQNIGHPITQGAHEFLKLEKGLSIIYVTGGSQGAVTLNDVLIDILPQLVDHFQIVHQAGKNNFDDCEKRARLLLESSPHKNRYKIFPYLNETALRMVGGVADLVITRAGSTTLFEIASWGTPAIVVPLPPEISHDQRTNAFTYARSGGAVVIEQDNLTPSVLLAEINRLLNDKELLQKMQISAKQFFRPDAGRVIAEELVKIALENE